MSFLKNKRCYLSGPIEHGQGPNWRTEPKKVLADELGVDVFDPFADIKQQWVPTLTEAKKNNDIDTIVKITHQFVRKDLSEVDQSKFLIAYLPRNVQTTGSVHEIINSNNAKKPTLLVTNSSVISDIPLWYFGFIPPAFMFAGWDTLFAYLREVDKGHHRDNDRWSVVYGLV